MGGQLWSSFTLGFLFLAASGSESLKAALGMLAFSFLKSLLSLLAAFWPLFLSAALWWPFCGPLNSSMVVHRALTVLINQLII